MQVLAMRRQKDVGTNIAADALFYTASVDDAPPAITRSVFNERTTLAGGDGESMSKRRALPQE